MQSVLFCSVGSREVKETAEGYQLLEPPVLYKVNFDVNNADIGPENRCFGDIIGD